MRTVVVVLGVALALGAVSCADMPTAPKAVVHVEGRVVDRDGAAVANAAIFIAPPEPPGSPSLYPPHPYRPTAVSDAQGLFRVDLVAGIYKADVVPPYFSGLPLLSVKTFEISPSDPNPILRFTGTYLYGRTIGPDGAELPFVSASAYSQTSGGSANYLGASPFRLLLSPGTYQLRVEQQASSGLPSLDTTVVVGSQDDSIQVALTGNRVTLHVTTNQSTPLPGCYISAHSIGYYSSSSATTDLNGNAQMYLRPGGYTIFVDPQVEGMVSWSFPVVIQGDVSLSYDLTPVRWTGTTRSSVDSSTVPLADISLGEFYGGAGGYVRSDVSGNFEILIRPAATYEVQAYAQGLLSIPTFVTLVSDSTFDLYLGPYRGQFASRGAFLAHTRTPSTPAPPAGPGIPGRGSSGR